MDRQIFCCFRSRLFINWLTKNVENTSQCIFTNGNRDGSACCDCVHTTNQTICRSHGYTSYRIIAQMLSNLNRKILSIFQRNFDGIVDFRQTAGIELDIQYGADNLSYLTDIFLCHNLNSFYAIFRCKSAGLISLRHLHLR